MKKSLDSWEYYLIRPQGFRTVWKNRFINMVFFQILRYTHRDLGNASFRKTPSPPFSVVLLCSCEKVFYKEEVRFLLYLICQIVTWQNNSFSLDLNLPCIVYHDWHLGNCPLSFKFKPVLLCTVKPELVVTSIKQPTCLKQPNKMFPNVNFVLIFTSVKQPLALSSHFLCFPCVAA